MLEHVPSQSDAHILHFRHTESHDHMTTLGPAPTQLQVSYTDCVTTLGPAQLQLKLSKSKVAAVTLDSTFYLHHGFHK